MSGKWIYGFDELSSAANDLVGKKCANLGELAGIGLQVPPGFAISVDAYDWFMEETGAGEQIRQYVRKHSDVLNKVDKQVEASRTIRELIESRPMPPEMKQELTGRYAELNRRLGTDDTPVAVRSSGAVSMPGQMETYLNVRGPEDLTRKVVQVWGSAFTTRAIAFRIEKGMEMEKAPIGVAVLKMVDAKCAGVCLTVLPTTGDTSQIIVEGNWGLGESVVSGQITPDQFIVCKATGGCQRVVNEKSLMVCYAGTGVRFAEVPCEMRQKSCLDDAELNEIVRIAKEVEAHFGVPQDLEWVVDRDLPFPDNVVWVQARPAKFTQKKQDEAEYLAELMSRLFKS